ncbi:MAG TPA: SDR family oxidoreductase [Spirillospora sp.]|nr:SDR family oxidoreductase [Spirillospora sp.]
MRGVDGQGGLAGRVAVVTGVGRRAGIGVAVARELLDAGASVLVQSWTPHDEQQPWGADPVEEVLGALGGVGPRLAHVAADFAEADAPGRVVRRAVEVFGAVDVVVANHARSAEQTLDQVTADELDRCWAVNARASVLLAQAFAEVQDDARPGGRIVLFTSGQHLGPMGREIPYAVSKGAIHELTARVAGALPFGRWGRPDDVARLVRWLVSDEGRWVTGQVINSEGGFRRWSL